MRFGAAGTFALLSAAAAFACVTPGNDYSAYEDRTANSDFTVQGGDASFDGSGAGFTNQNLVMVCTSQVAPASLSDATYFTVTASFHATDNSGNGTLDYSDTALALGPNNAPPTNVSSAVGAPAVVNGSVVTNGKVAVNFGPTDVPEPASPLGAEIDFSQTTLTILVQGGTLLCGNLGGSVTEPLPIPMLDPTQNVCVFAPPNADGSLPSFMTSQFLQCPPKTM